jgi:hypothetical protein
MKYTAIVLALSTLAAIASAQDTRCGSSPQYPDCMPLTSSSGQAVFAPVAFSRTPSLPRAVTRPYREFQLGVTASYVAPDYGRGVDVGVGGFIAVSGKHLGLEADVLHTIDKDSASELSVVVGPRLQQKAGPFTFYVKAQAGGGHFGNGTRYDNHSTFLIESYGGGLDLRISKHLEARLVDGNYQVWQAFIPHNLTPFNVGSGLALKF